MPKQIVEACIIPVKKLSKAKSRLSIIMNQREREAFVLAMLRDVLNALSDCKVIRRKIVISSDPLVLETAHELHAEVLRETSQGLNSAINEATSWCLKEGIESMLVIPADIPLITSADIDAMISMVNTSPTIVICPSRDWKGTNALFRCPPNAIPPCYGPDSFYRHLYEATIRKINAKLFYSSNIGSDIDSVEDVLRFIKRRSKTCSYRFLIETGIARRLLLNLPKLA